MTTFPISGGCLCGSVRYTVNGPAQSIEHCHCSMCRHSYASLVGTGAAISRNLVMLDKGEDNLTTFETSPGVRRQFCRTCGCSLFYLVDDIPEMMYYYPATLDGGVHPGHPEGSECHIYVGSKTEWESIDDSLPKFEEYAEGVGLATPIEREQGRKT